MSKIFITGNAGSGKTTLAKQLLMLLDRKEIIGLDKIVWKPDWISVNKSEKESEFQKIIEKEVWIVDGVSKTILENADIILFLDFPRYKCYWRAIKRNSKFLFKSRPELPENCPEIFILKQLLKIIWSFPTKVKPSIMEYISSNPQKKFFHITNNLELKRAIEEVINQVVLN